MKVILLGATPPPIGGIAQWTLRMIQAKLPNNWDIVLVDEKINTGREMFGNKQRYRLLPEIKRWLNIWKQLYIVTKDDDVRVVHACPTAEIPSMAAEYVSSIIAKIHHKRFITHFRCTVPNMVKGKFNIFLLKKLCNNSSVIIALNTQTKKFLEMYTNIPVVIIPNFIQSKELTAKHKTNNELRTIVYVGGVIEAKGCLDIIEVAKLMPNYTFRLVGRSDEVVTCASEKVPNIILTGPQDKTGVRNELNNADVFMFLSHYPGEGFSNALAEAMGAGLPCIVTDWAANADMIDDGKGGIVVKCGDIQGTIKALNDLQSQVKRQQQSSYNVNKARQYYSEEKILAEYVRCYELYS